ncbi:MAG: hypothetical protein ACSHXK_02785 [Oceanococcus sp.]
MIKACALPEVALLRGYRVGGAYTDCYSTSIDGAVSHAEFVEAFYTTALFKSERFILKWAVNRPSSDFDARQLALGASDQFAAWYVEDRAENQLLLSDFREQTRSWLMVVPAQGCDPSTTLYFGSAVVPKRGPDGLPDNMGLLFRALMGFHKVYSHALLYAASRRLRRLHQHKS